MPTATLVRERVQVASAEESLGRPISLEQALHDLCIDPFSPSSVQAYKARMQKQATPILSKCLLFFAEPIQFLFFLGFIGGCGGVIMGVVCSGLGYLFGYGEFMTLMQIGTYLACAIVCGFLNAKFGYFYVPVAQWRSIHMTCYTAPVPEFVTQTVSDLRLRYPSVSFWIEELRLGSQMLDPFLVACDSWGNTYHLEVWNEPGFKQKRVV